MDSGIKRVYDRMRSIQEADPTVPYYHCTSERNWERIQQKGWSAPIDDSDVAHYPQIFLDEIHYQATERFMELQERLPDRMGDRLRDDELVEDIKRAVRDVHSDSEFIWVSEEEKFTEYGDACLSVTLPQDAYFMVHDMRLGMLFRVPESPIEPHRFERVD